MAEIDRAQLWQMLGYPGGMSREGCAIIWHDRQTIDGVLCDSVTIQNAGRALPGILLRPKAPGAGAGVLYCHAHGNRYDIGKTEMTHGRPALLDPPLGLVLARAGYTVLCVDMPGFGARHVEGTEAELAKAALWQGRCLIGDMVRDQILAVRALRQLEAVDQTRIATLGLSMGATLAYLVAALDPAIAACAHICAFAQMSPLIALNAHDLHGIYMTIPGLLRVADMDDIAALIAPRPQLICAGLKDPLTPAPALTPAIQTLRTVYARLGHADRLEIQTDADSGHQETPAFRRATLDFLASL